MRAPRAELIAEVMLALTDTSHEDFDVAELLYTLTTASVESGCARGNGPIGPTRRINDMSGRTYRDT